MFNTINNNLNSINFNECYFLIDKRVENSPIILYTEASFTSPTSSSSSRCTHP